MVAGVVCACMLPSSAITIDGDEYELVTITQQDIINMFSAGDLTVTFTLNSSETTSHNYGSFFQMNNGLTLNPSISSSSPYIISSDRFNLTAVGSDQIMVYAPYAFWAYPNSGSLSDILHIDFEITLPFSGYVDQQNYKFWFFQSGLYSNVSTGVYGYLGNSQSFSTSGSAAPSAIYWKDVPATQTFYSLYNRVPPTETYNNIQSLMTYSSRNSTYTGHREIDSIKYTLEYDSLYVNGSDVYWAPIALVFQTGFQLYLTPSDAEEVTDYLSLIASNTPTAAQQSELNELRSSFADKKNKMNEWAEDLHAEVPERPGLDELPTVEIDGEDIPMVDVVNEVSQTVVSPLFNYNIVTILVSSVLGISFIKILLFGSGPS